MLLGASYDQQGQTDLAEKFLKRGVRLIELNKGRRHPSTIAALEALRLFYTAHQDKASLDRLQWRLGAAAAPGATQSPAF